MKGCKVPGQILKVLNSALRKFLQNKIHHVGEVQNKNGSNPNCTFFVGF